MQGRVLQTMTQIVAAAAELPGICLWCITASMRLLDFHCRPMKTSMGRKLSQAVNALHCSSSGISWPPCATALMRTRLGRHADILESAQKAHFTQTSNITCRGRVLGCATCSRQ